MTYFAFLAQFVGIPILCLSLLLLLNKRRLPSNLTGRPWGVIIAAHVVIAVLWTTPWDNYLVATNVWWYDPELVTGLVIGWVPIEEYTFFVVQTVLCGLWLVWLAQHLPVRQDAAPNNKRFRAVATGLTGIIWIASIVILVVGWTPGTYLGLELSWMLFPVLIQLAFGADILWHHRWLVLLAVFVPGIYLSGADAIAINAGTWTIDPVQTVGLVVGGILPIEEIIFFHLTSLLVGFGITLMIAEESQERAEQISRRVKQLIKGRKISTGVQANNGLNTSK